MQRAGEGRPAAFAAHGTRTHASRGPNAHRGVHAAPESRQSRSSAG